MSTPGTMPSTAFFGDARGFQISGGSFAAVAGDNHTHNIYAPSSRGLDILKEATAVGASYDARERYPPPQCLAGTRVGDLEAIKQWANESGPPILWLNGGVGAGKSAIAQTFSEWCAKHNRLAASFFFRRGDQRRASTRCICATLALQLASTLPETRAHMERALEEDPLILEKDLRTQFFKLLIKPLEKVSANGVNVPLIVVVDALDECDDPVALKELVLALDATYTSNVTRTPFRYLITSRPEHGIQSLINRLSSHLSMELDGTKQVDDDVRYLLNTRFSDIRDRNKDTMCYVGPTWPACDVVEKIVRKSSGHFIYASIVLNFVDEEDAYPPDQLDIILGNMSPSTGQSPFEALDELYHGILERAAKRNEDLLKSILGYITVARFHVTVHELGVSLGSRKADIAIVLRSLRSLIKIDDGLREEIHFLHASFPDFLLDGTRSNRFAIRNTEHIEKLALSHLKSSNGTNGLNLYSLRNASYYLARCALPLCQDIHIAFQALVFSKHDQYPQRIIQHSPEKIGANILQSLLRSTFSEICNRHKDDIQPPWPQHVILEYLVETFSMVTSDQLLTISTLLQFIDRGDPPQRLKRFLQILSSKKLLWRLEALHEWIFYLICDSDHRANLCLRMLALIDAAQQSGTHPPSTVIQFILGSTHDDLRQISQDFHPFIICHGSGNDSVFMANERFITSCIDRDWSGDYNIGQRIFWQTDLTLTCIRRQKDLNSGSGPIPNTIGFKPSYLWIKMLVDCPPSNELFVALTDVDHAAMSLTREMADIVLQWLHKSPGAPTASIRQWEVYRDSVQMLPVLIQTYGTKGYESSNAPLWNPQPTNFEDGSSMDHEPEVTMGGGENKMPMPLFPEEINGGNSNQGHPDAVEKENKKIIRKATIECLAMTKDTTGIAVDRYHKEFKKICGYVNRGVGFALRAHIRIKVLDHHIIDRLVKTHVGMYVGGVA